MAPVPPLVHGIVNFNPVVLGMALLLSPVSWAAPLARFQYAVPLITKPRTLLVFALAAGVTAPLWPAFVDELPVITARYSLETASSGYWAMPLSGWGSPIWLAGAAGIVVLAILDIRSALLLSIPVLLPTSSFYDGITALPIASAPVLAAMALPIPGAPAAATWVLVFQRRREHKRALLGKRVSLPSG